MKTYFLTIAGLFGLTLAILITANIFWQAGPEPTTQLENVEQTHKPVEAKFTG